MCCIIDLPLAFVLCLLKPPCVEPAYKGIMHTKKAIIDRVTKNPVAARVSVFTPVVVVSPEMRPVYPMTASYLVHRMLYYRSHWHCVSLY